MPPYIYMSASQVDSAAARHKTVRGWKSQFSCVSACQRRLMFWLPSRTILIQSGHTQYSSLYGGTEFYWTIFNNLCQPLKLAKSHRNHLGIMVFYISGECFHLPAALSNTWLSTIAGSRCCFKVLINYAGHNNVFLASVSSCLILIPWWSVAFLFISKIAYLVPLQCPPIICKLSISTITACLFKLILLDGNPEDLRRCR